MKIWNHESWRAKLRGQSLVEMALVLPLFLILFLGMVEVGFGMYKYLQIATANREGVRMASRGRFTDETSAQRIIASAGSYEKTPGVMAPYLRTAGADSNTGIIITHIDIPATGLPTLTYTPTYYVTGTLTIDTAMGRETRPIEPEDGKIPQMSMEELADYIGLRRSITESIHDYREANDYEAISVERYVIVETFYSHNLILRGAPGIPDPLRLYFASTMREMRDSRLD